MVLSLFLPVLSGMKSLSHQVMKLLSTAVLSFQQQLSLQKLLSEKGSQPERGGQFAKLVLQDRPNAVAFAASTLRPAGIDPNTAAPSLSDAVGDLHAP